MSRKIVATLITLILGLSWAFSVCAETSSLSDPINLTPDEQYLQAIQAYEKCLENWPGVLIIDCSTPECGPPEHY
jgi:hypothetical protein